MADETRAEVYRLHVWIGRISPMIWRRLLVRSDSTIADLHYTLQTAFGWVIVASLKRRAASREYAAGDVKKSIGCRCLPYVKLRTLR
ncbi:MAG: IS1096 element passenger TnpR family protein [Steroidobacteraceae bacterium]